MDNPLGFFLSYHQLFKVSLFIVILGFMVMKTLRYYLVDSKKPKLPPGPKPWPIVGNFPEMLANKPAFRWFQNIMEEFNTEIACIRLGNVHLIHVTCPTIAREFLRKHDASFASRPKTMYVDIISNGYLTTALAPFGEQHRKMKKIMVNDILSPLRHQQLQNKRNEEANNLVVYVHNICNNNSGLVNLRIVTQHYCGNMFRKLVFGTRYFGKGRSDGGPGFEEVEHVDASLILLKYIYNFSMSNYISCLRMLDVNGHKSKVKNVMRIMNKYHDPIIEKRIKQWNDGSKTSQEDLLDVLISLKDVNDEPLLMSKEIKAQITEIMLELIDNPSNTVEWALAEMISQPKLLQKAIEELDNVVGIQRQVQESDIRNLNFIKACAKESLRLHPTVAFNVPHVSMKDTIVKGYLIPKGSQILLSRRGLGRNPKVWIEPQKFKPERHFKNDESQSDFEIALTEPDLKFISFSTGRRSCPGVVLGTTMTVMLLARLLHGFTWSVPSNISSINLVESKDDLLLAEPLLAMAKPRLASELYDL